MGGFHAQGTSNAESVSISWRQHVYKNYEHIFAQFGLDNLMLYYMITV